MDWHMALRTAIVVSLKLAALSFLAGALAIALGGCAVAFNVAIGNTTGSPLPAAPQNLPFADLQDCRPREQ